MLTVAVPPVESVVWEVEGFDSASDSVPDTVDPESGFGVTGPSFLPLMAKIAIAMIATAAAIPPISFIFGFLPPEEAPPFMPLY